MSGTAIRFGMPLALVLSLAGAASGCSASPSVTTLRSGTQGGRPPSPSTGASAVGVYAFCPGLASSGWVFKPVTDGGRPSEPASAAIAAAEADPMVGIKPWFRKEAHAEFDSIDLAEVKDGSVVGPGSLDQWIVELSVLPTDEPLPSASSTSEVRHWQHYVVFVGPAGTRTGPYC